MRLRLARISEYQLLKCLQHGVWGTERIGFRNWMEDDMLAFKVDKQIAGLAKVTGKSFYSEEKIWSNGLFPFRIPIEVICVLDINDRVPILGQVRDAITRSWGKTYGWGILNKAVLPAFAGNIIVNEILSKPNSLAVFQKELLDRLGPEEP